MCVVSMVHDHFHDVFSPWIKPNILPFLPYSPPEPPPTDWQKIFDEARRYQEAIAAAKIVDSLTKQPDCVDPEKAKLEKRVAELEETVCKLIASQPTAP